MIYHCRRSHIPLLSALIIVLIPTYCQAATVDVNPRRHVKPILTTRGGSALSLPSWSNKIIAGGTSRAVAQALLYPVDALRTLAQTRGKDTSLAIISCTLKLTHIYMFTLLTRWAYFE